MYLLDTNICIYIIKKRPESILTKFEQLDKGTLFISVITLAELQYGIEKSSSKKLNQDIVDEFCSLTNVLIWDKVCAREYGKIRCYLESKGTPIGNMDLLIAAHAMSLGYILVSNNIREFARVPGLKYENWI